MEGSVCSGMYWEQTEPLLAIISIQMVLQRKRVVKEGGFVHQLSLTGTTRLVDKLKFPTRSTPSHKFRI